MACTLLGSLSRYNLNVESKEAQMVWSREAKGLEKVNCMQSNGIHIVAGGFSYGGKGLVEVYGT